MRKRSIINQTKREDVLLMPKFFKKIQVIFIGARFFSKVIKSLSVAFGLHRKNIQSIVNKGDDQNYENSENIETENSTNVNSFNADIIRHVVHDYYSEKQLLTLAKVRNRLEQEHGIEIRLYKLLLYVIR